MSRPPRSFGKGLDVTADEAIAATSVKKDHSGAVMFLMDMLSNGKVPVKLIEERAAARGLSPEKMEGLWFWCLPQHAPAANGDVENER